MTPAESPQMARRWPAAAKDPNAPLTRGNRLCPMQGKWLRWGVESEMSVQAGVGVLDGVRPVGSVRCRRERTDITVRDTRALRWVGEQSGARLDVVGVLLGRLGDSGGPVSLRTVRDVVARWERRGLAVAERSATGVWVSLNRRGLDRVGLGRLREYRVPWNLERHHHAVNVARLSYEAVPREAGWVAERLLWAERGEESWHVPDGLIRAEDWRGGGMSTGIEVELSRKPRREYRDEVFGKLLRGAHPVKTVRYFTASERFRDALTQDLGAVIGTDRRVEWSVELLPTVAGVSYIPEGGGRRG